MSAAAQAPPSRHIQEIDPVSVGADPLGTMDSTPAFRKAISSLKQQGGGTLRIPCGSYLITSKSTEAAIVIDTPYISFVGENQSCVSIEYKGTGTAISFQMVPFILWPAGEMKNFTLNGTAAGQVGIRTGAIIGATFENINVRAFSSGSAFEIDDDKSIAPPKGPWTERNAWINISEWNNKIGFHLQSPGKPENNSFGYNEFFSLYMNVSTDQVGFWLDKDSYLYNGSLRASCNLDDERTGVNGPICVRVSGNWKNEMVVVTGEYNPAFRRPKLQGYALQVDPTGEMTGWGNVSVIGASVRNLRNASFTPTARLSTDLATWDSGAFTLNGATATPEVAFGGRSGTVGILGGKNIESPFVTMYKFGGNKFIVGAVAYDSPIGNMTPVWTVDDAGNVDVSSNEDVKGLSTVEGGLQLSTRGPRPQCGPATRGRIWQTFAQNEHEDDHLDICQRRNGTYQWISR